MIQSQYSPGVFTVWNENYSSQPQQNREIQSPPQTSRTTEQSRTEEEPVSVNTENYFTQEFQFKKQNKNLEAEMTRGRSNIPAAAYDDKDKGGANRRTGVEEPSTHLQYFNQEFQFNRENVPADNSRQKIRKHGSGGTKRKFIQAEKQRKTTKTTDDDEYQDLVRLVEQLNKKFSRFKKFIRISDQEVDSLKEPTMQISITRKPTPQSRRKHQYEVEPAIEKPPLDLKRIKQKAKFIKKKKNGKIRKNGNQKMPSFPNFPQTEKQKKRESLSRSRVGDLPEFAYDNDNEDYPERMLSSIVYLSHGIRV